MEEGNTSVIEKTMADRSETERERLLPAPADESEADHEEPAPGVPKQSPESKKRRIKQSPESKKDGGPVPDIDMTIPLAETMWSAGCMLMSVWERNYT